MDPKAIERLEKELGVSLPPAYVQLLVQPRPSVIDTVSVSDDVEFIIERTKEHREGFAGAPGWPEQFIYVGDEDDACPYALDCATGVIVWTDHGNLDQRPLQRYGSVADFIAAIEASHAEAGYDPSSKGKKWWQFWR